MTAVYPDRVIVEYYNGSAWVDISAYVVGDITGSIGLGGWKPEARVAVLGTLNLTLNNKAKLFSPMGGDVVRGLNTLSGFTRGAMIQVRFTIAPDVNKTKWFGRIQSIDSDDKNWGREQVRITAVDYMDVPARYPMKGATIATNQLINTALALLAARLPISPQASDFDTGTITFPAVFDNVRNNSMAISEFTKLANSELGYIYTKGDGTLKAESANARVGTRALDKQDQHPIDYKMLAKEDGDLLLLETGDELILNEMYAVALNMDAESYNILLEPGAILNSAIVRAYPVSTDTSLKVLYSMGTPLLIPGKSTASFSAHYTDPNGNAQISGTNLQAPASTTDYTANTLASGAGTDKTASLTVTATYHGDTVEYVLANGDNGPIYVTKLQARGYGIYYGNSIETTVEDAASQAAYGINAFQFDQRYQRSPYAGIAYARQVINEYAQPKSRITKMSYLANLNKSHLMAFLCLTVGSLIAVYEDRSALTNHYYVTDVAFTARQGGIINVTYGLKQNDTLLSGGLNPLAIEFAGGAATDAIAFGRIPRLENLQKFSVSIWVYADNPDGDVIVAYKAGPVRGWNLGLYTNKVITFSFSADLGGGSFGINNWGTGINAFSTGQWVHIVATRDQSIPLQDSSVDIYVNGVKKTVTMTYTGGGTDATDEGGILTIGNYDDGTSRFIYSHDGKLFDARVYDHVLSQAEVTALYNSGTPDELIGTSGLLFQGPNINADRGTSDDLAGTTLTATDLLSDNVRKDIGIPNGAPVVRARP